MAFSSINEKKLRNNASLASFSMCGRSRWEISWRPIGWADSKFEGEIVGIGIGSSFLCPARIAYPRPVSRLIIAHSNPKHNVTARAKMLTYHPSGRRMQEFASLLRRRYPKAHMQGDSFLLDVRRVSGRPYLGFRVRYRRELSSGWRIEPDSRSSENALSIRSGRG